MAIRGLSFSEDEEYVSRDDEDRVLREDKSIDVPASREKGATVFIIGNVPGGVMAEIQDMGQIIETEQFSSKSSFRQQPNARARRAFKYGVKNILNFIDGLNRPVTVDTEQKIEGGRVCTVLTEGTMDCIPTAIITEVGQQVISRNTMTETQAKKFEALSLQLGASNTSPVTTATTVSDSAEGTTDPGKNETSKETTS